ncbi:hypothetical protein NST07_25960 [Paenibacillus sp. FSL L8-0340]|uniref:hypothetical protein n=1 Tax=Paenibacillus sp. FSL L8-0340 TaxID=2954685 RepID=UPI003158200A
MSSACMCHVEGAFCFYCEVYSPVVAENERLQAEVRQITESRDFWKLDAMSEVARAESATIEAVTYASKNEELFAALREIDTHIRATSDPVPQIVSTLKQVLPEYAEESGDPFADEEVLRNGSTQESGE